MSNSIDPKLLEKLAKKVNKTLKYTREQISKKASSSHVSSSAYLVYWANQIGIGTARYLSSLDPHIQEQARSLASSSIVGPAQPALTVRLKIRTKTQQTNYVDSGRLQELRSINNTRFDFKRLIKMCEELNRCNKRGDFIAAIALVRSILNHVPPIFGNNNFTQVQNNSKVARSNRESFQFLDSHSRKIADAYLHIPIRSSEMIPTRTQVDFSQSLDVLLAEVIRIR